MDKHCQLYRHFDGAGTLLYVGTALCAVLRNETHRRMASWFSDVRTIKIEQFCSRLEAEIAEAAAVLNEHPLYNVRLTGRRAPAALPVIPDEDDYRGRDRSARGGAVRSEATR